MVAGLLKDGAPLVWVEMIGLCNVLDEIGLEKVEADRCVDP